MDAVESSQAGDALCVPTLEGSSVDAVESSQAGDALCDSLLRDRQWMLLSPPKLAMPHIWTHS